MSKQEKTQVENFGFCKDGVISMDATRAKQFNDVVHRILKNVQSLNASAASFPQPDLDGGEMDARATVSAFSRPIIDDINLVYNFIENEEPAENLSEGEDDHA